MKKSSGPWITALRIFLLVLIIIGLILLATTNFWVPSVVSLILKSEGSNASINGTSAIVQTSVQTPTSSSTNATRPSPVSKPVTTSPVPTPTPTPTSVSSSSIPLLDSITPTSAAVGTSVTITGSNFANSNTVLFDGNVAARDVLLDSSSGASESITFSVPSSLTPDCKADQACPAYALLTSPRTYSVTVESTSNAGNANERSNSLSFTVTGGTTPIPQ